MNRNPIIPFLLIMVFGIGLVFFLSLKGLNDSEQAAKEKRAAKKRNRQLRLLTPKVSLNKHVRAATGKIMKAA